MINDLKAFAPSEEGSAVLSINSSKLDMKYSALIQAWLVASIPIWRMFRASPVPLKI